MHWNYCQNNNDPVFFNDPNGADPNSDGWNHIQESRNYDMERNYYNTHGIYGDDDMYGSMFGKIGAGVGNWYKVTNYWMEESGYKDDKGNFIHDYTYDYSYGYDTEMMYVYENQQRRQRQTQGGTFNLVDGIVKINGVTSTYVSYNTSESSGTLVQALPGGNGVTVYNYDFKSNSRRNPKFFDSYDLGSGDKYERSDGWRIPRSLVRAFAGEKFQEAFGGSTNSFWNLFALGQGSVYYMSSMSGDALYNGQEYNKTTYRFTANFSIFTGQNNPAILVGLVFYVSQYNPK